MKIAALVLAAGGSTRLGQPKQLLQYRGQSLICHTVDAAREAGCSPIIVVIGRDWKEIAAELQNLPVTLVPNENWERGIGTSIRAGVAALPELDAVVLLACDQPAVNANFIERLIRTHAVTQQPVVAAAYSDTVGVPALFARPHFSALLSLSDGQGAKTLMAAHPDKVARVEFPQGAVDIDTVEDFARLVPR